MGHSIGCRSTSEGDYVELAEPCQDAIAIGYLFELDLVPLLSDQEAQILRLLTSGYATKEIAHDLGLSYCLVESISGQLLHVAGVHNRTQLAMWAIRSGYISAEEAASAIEWRILRWFGCMEHRWKRNCR